jgi:hypothetical protein
VSGVQRVKIEVVQQLRDRFPERRVPSVRRDLGERFEDEAALVHARVGDFKAGFPDDLVLVKEKIEIERARSPAFRANPSERTFDPQEQIEEIPGGKVRVERDGGVEEIRLVRLADRERFDEAARAEDHDAPVAKALERRAQVRFAIAEVRAKPDICPRHSVSQSSSES